MIRSLEIILSKTSLRLKYHYVESIIRPKTLLERNKSLYQKRKELYGIKIYRKTIYFIDTTRNNNSSS
jgi:hypothetical protein